MKLSVYIIALLFMLIVISALSFFIVISKNDDCSTKFTDKKIRECSVISPIEIEMIKKDISKITLYFTKETSDRNINNDDNILHVHISLNTSKDISLIASSETPGIKKKDVLVDLFLILSLIKEILISRYSDIDIRFEDSNMNNTLSKDENNPKVEDMGKLPDLKYVSKKQDDSVDIRAKTLDSSMNSTPSTAQYKKITNEMDTSNNEEHVLIDKTIDIDEIQKAIYNDINLNSIHEENISESECSFTKIDEPEKV